METFARATYFATVVAWIALILPVVWTFTTGDYPGPMFFYGQQEDSEFVDLVFDLRAAL